MSLDSAPDSVRIIAAQRAAMLYPARRAMALDPERINYFRVLIGKGHWSDYPKPERESAE